MINPIQLGIVIKQARLDKNLSQEQFAEMLDITPTHVKHIESGRRNPSVTILFQMADILSFSLDSLIDNSKNRITSHKKDRIINILNDCNEKELDIIADIVKVIYNHKTM